MSRLITPSLFSSTDWFKNAPTKFREKAYKDLYNMLARKWTEPNEQAKRGMDFEKHIYQTITNKRKDIVKCSDKFKEVLQICDEGQFQVKAKRFIIVDSIEYCLYGKIDVLFPDCIIDIKTTSKWNQYSEAKYLTSMQHVLYLYIKNMQYFKYVIAVFENEKSNTIQELHIVSIEAYPRERAEEVIIEAIRNQMSFFKEHPVLYDLYLNKYSLY